MLMSLTFNNPIAIVVSIFVILIIISDIIDGYKKGFLESGVKFLKTLVAMLIAYFCKAPLSKYMYLNLPFFQLEGIFKGVSSLNVIIYEIIAFFVIFALVLLIINIVSAILKLDEKVLRLVSIIGVPNKIMGAVINGLKSIVLLYFGLSLFFVGANFMKWDVGESLGTYIVEMPLLKNTFGNILDSCNEITDLAVEYENIQDKEELNNKSIDILLEYDIISEENLELLIESGKIDYSVNKVDEQKDMVSDLYEAIINN